MIAIIPAKGSSKGLPNKNLKLLNGKPLICYSIESAKRCPHITHIFVSTDCDEIAKIAREAGAWVPALRPSYLATDDAKSADVYLYTLNFLKKEYDLEFKSVIVLQPTSPLRGDEDINCCVEMYFKTGANAVISYTQESHPIFWHKFINKEGLISDVFVKNKLSNRQDYQKTYYPNGAIYIINASLILEGKNFHTNNSYAYIMPRERSVDIDILEDFEYAEFLLSRRS